MNTVALLVVIGCVAAVLVRRRSAASTPSADPRRVLGSVAANLARASTAGMTAAEALAAAAERFEGPVGEELGRVRDCMARGATLDRALLDWVTRARLSRAPVLRTRRGPDPDDVELLVGAIRFGEPRGAGLVEAFEGVAAALVDRAELDSEVRALTSQAWASVAVLCSLPLLGLVMAGSVAPSVPGVLFGTPLGLACLGVATALDVAAMLLARRLSRRALS